jgi:hypothetical protein
MLYSPAPGVILTEAVPLAVSCAVPIRLLSVQ